MVSLSTTKSDIQEYLATIEDCSISKKMEGYFPVDVVIDAFTKGEEIGKEKAIQKFREAFERRSIQAFLYGRNLGDGLIKRGYSVTGFYINPINFKVIIETTPENTYNEDFIEAFFELSYDYQDRFKKDFDSSMEMMFIKNEEVNEKALEIDGFIKIKNVGE